MKKLIILFSLIGIILSGCGEQGPPGPPGFNGLDGVDGEESFVFEYELSFTAPDYSAFLNLPNDFTMLDSDVMLIYFLWEVNNGTEVWRLLPQTLYFQEGIVHYNFDHTKYDANVFLDGTINRDLLSAAYTDNWIARVVVVPAQFTGGRALVDYTDYDQVKELFNLGPSKLAPDNYSRRPQ